MKGHKFDLFSTYNILPDFLRWNGTENSFACEKAPTKGSFSNPVKYIEQPYFKVLSWKFLQL